MSPMKPKMMNGHNICKCNRPCFLLYICAIGQVSASKNPLTLN